MEEKSVKIVLKLICIYLLMMAIPIMVRKYLYETDLLNGYMYTILSAVCWTSISVIVAKLDHLTWNDLGIRRRNMFRQIGTGIILFLIQFSIFKLIPLIMDSDSFTIAGTAQITMNAIIRNFVLYVVFVALAEEIFFRGYFYAKIKTESNNPRLAIFVTAMLFGIAHIHNILDILTGIHAILVGTLYGIFREKVPNCSLISLILAHGLNNIMADLLSGNFH